MGHLPYGGYPKRPRFMEQDRHGGKGRRIEYCKIKAGFHAYELLLDSFTAVVLRQGLLRHDGFPDFGRQLRLRARKAGRRPQKRRV